MLVVVVFILKLLLVGAVLMLVALLLRIVLGWSALQAVLLK